MHDKDFWRAVCAADYAVPDGEDAWALTQELLGYLGHPDPEVRDDFAYSLIATWTIRGKLTTDHLRAITQRLLPNLTLGLGEFRGDRVLLRSFSALVLSIMAYGEHKTPYLSQPEYAEIVAALCDYLKGEIDLRGYDSTVGWIHTTAHTADWIKFLARSPQAAHPTHHALLMVIADKLLIPTAHVYIHNEDHRMALATMDLLKRDLLTADDLSGFMQHLLKVHEMGTNSTAFDPTIHATAMNVKQYLRAIYVLLTVGDPVVGAHDLVAHTREALKTFN